MKLNYKKIKFNYTHIITFILGIITFYLSQEISTYFNRPQIDIKPKSITIYEEFDGQWKLDLNVRIINSGKTRDVLVLKSFSLLFDSLSDRPYTFNLDSIYTIDANFTLSKVLSVKFPATLKSFSLEATPKFSKLNISAKDIINQEEISSNIDSTGILLGTVFESTKKEVKYFKDVQIDSSKNKVKFLTKPFYITYHGKKYLNHVYPRDVNIQYQIKGNKIQLEYTQSLGTTKLNSKAKGFPGIMLFPNPFLKDKIIYPTKTELLLNVEKRGKDKILYEDYKVEVHNTGRTYMYILK